MRKCVPVLLCFLLHILLLASCADTAVQDPAESFSPPASAGEAYDFREEAGMPIPESEPEPTLSTPEPTPSPAPEPSSEPAPPSFTPVTLGCVGDIYLSPAVYSYYINAENSVEGFLKNGMADCFRNVDIMLANHEYVTSDRTSDDNRDIRQRYNFRAPSEREFLWNEMGVDVVSLANNHALDYGKECLLDTVSLLDEQNILHCGAGADVDAALSAAILEKNGKKIAFLAASRVVVNVDWYATASSPGVLTTYESTPYFQRIKDEITRLKEEEQCDFVVVYVHFGEEGESEIRPYQKTVSHGYIDAGADLVFGGHAHTLQGIEIYEGKPIFYNMGNFLFTGFSTDSMFAEITILEDNTCTAQIKPCVTKSYIATLCADEEKQRLLRYVESLSVNVKIDEDGNISEIPEG